MLKAYKNKLIAIDLYRRLAIKLRRFPTEAELASQALKEHAFDASYFKPFQRLDVTNSEDLASTFDKLSLHIQIALLYIKNRILDPLDRFTYSMIKGERLWKQLKTVRFAAMDRARRMRNRGICVLERLMFDNYSAIDWTNVSGVEIDFGNSFAYLERNAINRIDTTKATITCKTANPADTLSAGSGSLLSSILSDYDDTDYSCRIRTSDKTGKLDIRVDLPKKEKFNDITIRLVSAAKSFIIVDGRIIASSKTAELRQRLNFKPIISDYFVVRIEQEEPIQEGPERTFYIAVASISVAFSSFSQTGTITFSPLEISELSDIDSIAIETPHNMVGEVVFKLQAEATGGTVLCSDVELISGQVFNLKNTVLHGPAIFNPVVDDNNAAYIYRNAVPSDNITRLVEKRDPIRGTILRIFPVAAFSDHPSLVIPESLRITPYINMGKVETFIAMRRGNVQPDITEWDTDYERYKKAITDPSVVYRSGIVKVLELLDYAPRYKLLEAYTNTRLDFYIKAPNDVEKTFKVFVRRPVWATYYLDNKPICITGGDWWVKESNVADCHISLKAGRWHKLTIVLYSAGDQPVDPIWDGDEYGAQSLRSLFVSERIAVSAFPDGELSFTEAEDISFVGNSVYTITEYEEEGQPYDGLQCVFTDAKIGPEYGTCLLTWKEWADSNSRAVKVNLSAELSLNEFESSPEVGHIIVMGVRTKASDPCCAYMLNGMVKT